MRTRFNGAPIVPGGQSDRINAIHDAFVVRGRSVRINARKIVGHDDPIANLFSIKTLASQQRSGDSDFGTHQSAIGEVG